MAIIGYNNPLDPRRPPCLLTLNRTRANVPVYVLRQSPRSDSEALSQEHPGLFTLVLTATDNSIPLLNVLRQTDESWV